MRIQAITNLRSYNNYQVKHCNITKNYSTSPMAVDTFTPSVAFKGIREAQKAIDNDDAEALRREIEKGLDVNSVLNTDYKNPLIEYAGFNGSINCLRELRKHKVNMYAEDKYGNFCFSAACCLGYNDIVQELVNNPEYNINCRDTLYGRTGLMRACFWGKEDIVDIILQRPDVDLTLQNKAKETAEDIARRRGYDKIVEKLQNYAKKVGNKTGAAKNVSNTEIEQQIAERVLKTQMDAVKKQQAELSEREEALKRREAELENTINTRAEEMIAEEKAQLAKNKKAYLNLLKIQQELIAEEVEAQKRGFISLFGLDKEVVLPEKMNIVEQMLYVTKTLVKNKNKVIINDDTQQNVTKALQDKNGSISIDGLKFLDNVLKTNENSCSENDLITAIETVKNENGYIDTNKAALFISSLALGFSFNNVIKKVKKYCVKA